MGLWLDVRGGSMKHHLSIKLKLTLWFTCFMVLIAAVCLVLILAISSKVAQKEAFQTLSLTVRANVTELALIDGKLSISPDFTFYHNNVYFLIYGSNKILYSGQAPPNFPIDTELNNGMARYVSGGENGFYILDFWIPSGWEDGLWLRGVLQSPNTAKTLGSIFIVFLSLLPFFIFSAAIGGYYITKKNLEPISQITNAAGAISEGKDLTKRIGLPIGKDEISRLANSFDHMFERLEQSFEAEKQFTSDASHELRTPIAVILAQCSYAKKHADTISDYQEAIEVIDRQAQKMSLLIERLLDITRLELGTQKLQMEFIHLSEMVSILCEEQDTKYRGISIITQIEENITLYADPFLISRVITNLLDNARKYGKENGTIFLRLSATNTMITLEIEDNGIGIAPQHLDKIWQRFYQVNPSRDSNSGIGLGLSMAHQIILLHHGTITVTSTFGYGSCFTITLPIKQ